MHPTIASQIMTARTADLHRRADTARLVQAAKHVRRARRQPSTHRLLPGRRSRPVPYRTTA
jgi:hypothetical protein